MYKRPSEFARMHQSQCKPKKCPGTMQPDPPTIWFCCFIEHILEASDSMGGYYATLTCK